MGDEPLSRVQAEEILRPVLPDVAVTEVVARTGGQLSSVYEVRCEGAQPAVVKVYSEQWRWKQAKEVHVYRLLAEHGVGPIPAVLRAEADGEQIGSAFTVMTLLPGRPLSEVGAQLDSAAMARVYRQMGGMLAAMHRIGQEAFGYLTTRILEPEPDNTAYMTRQFARKLGEFRDLGGDSGLHDGVQAYLDKHVGLFATCAAPVLCHNDFHEGNVLVSPLTEGWSVTGLIDVENAIAADPLLDLAKTDCYSVRGDAVKFGALVDGYGPLPDDAPARLSLYRLYHSLELWDWFAMIGNTEPLTSIAEDIRGVVSAQA
jgi:hygromycin-B 7''-O-kinase